MGKLLDEEMMINAHRRLQKLLLIIIQLSQSPTSIQSLSERFDTSERTIYRYLGTLRDSGFKIEHNQMTKRLKIVSWPDDLMTAKMLMASQN